MLAKKETLSMRISESDKQLLNRAANLLGVNLTSFVLQSAMNEAHETLKHGKSIELTKRDFKKLLKILESSEPNKRLKDAFSHYDEVIR